MSISDKIQALEASRQAIATAIAQKGGTVAQGDGFSQFATEISNLPSGGSGNPLIETIDVSDFSGTTFNAAVSYITDVTIPSGVTSIADGALSDATSLTSVTIPNSVTSIGKYAFNNCINLTTVNIPSGVTYIQQQTFAQCYNLESITLPNNLALIGVNAFFACQKLKTITLPATISEIARSAFASCTALESIVSLKTTPPTLASSVFNKTNNCPIYVPAESVETYKAASGWSEYVSRIYPIQQVATVDGNPVYNYELGNTDSTVISDDERSKIPTGDSIEFAEGVTQIGGQLGAYEEVILPSTFTSFNDTQPINAATTTLTSKATTPPSVERSNLGGSGLTAVYVPASAVDTYKAHAAWGTFSSIIQAIPTE